MEERVERNEWNFHRLTTENRSEEGRGGSPESFPGCRLLTGAGPREVLRRISSHDPLAMKRRCLHLLHRRALLVSLERLTHRALARTAYAAGRYRGEPSLDDFLDECVDAALDDLLREDFEQERAAGRSPQVLDRRYTRAARVLGVGVEQGRRASVLFHALPRPARAERLR
jgi:hypothetical protein